MTDPHGPRVVLPGTTRGAGTAPAVPMPGGQGRGRPAPGVEALDRVEQAYSRLESFNADVAHELKNPLTSLRSAVETLPLAKTAESKARLTEIIQHDVRRLDRLISDISNASRLDAELARQSPSVASTVPVTEKSYVGLRALKTYGPESQRERISAVVRDPKTGREKPINSIYMMAHSGARGSQAQIKQLAGINVLHVPYQGFGPMIPAMLSGRVPDMYCHTIP